MIGWGSPIVRLWRSDAAFRLGSIAGALAGFVPMLYVGMVFGTLGGSWGNRLLGPAIGIPVGILASLVFLIGGTLTAGSAGGLVAMYIARSWKALASR